MIFSTLRSRLAGLLIILATAGLGGCATGPNPADPFEPWNRRVANFNEHVDSVVLKPAAIGYRQAVPAPARTGINNFFANLGDGWSAVNNLLQLRVHHALETWMRFGVNSFLGFGGILDLASELGIERHRADFGQTLGRWGVETGPYMVLPLLGPSTLRDTLALPVDHWGDPVRIVEGAPLETGLYALRAVDTRANLLRASSVLDDAALDKYSFTRDAYLQRRRAQVNGAAAEGSGSDGAEPDYSR